jgi:hypothetical protein
MRPGGLLPLCARLEVLLGQLLADNSSFRMLASARAAAAARPDQQAKGRLPWLTTDVVPPPPPCSYSSFSLSFAAMSSSKAVPPATATWDIPGGSEYRFELDQTESIAVQVRQAVRHCLLLPFTSWSGRPH